MEFLLTLIVMATAMIGMSIGVIVSSRRLRGSCGGPDVADANGEHINCGACAKSQADLCPTEEPLVQLAQIGHPNPREHHLHLS